jgi:hypothetical protein
LGEEGVLGMAGDRLDEILLIGGGIEGLEYLKLAAPNGEKESGGLV